jgi:hypothetical protein
MIRVKHPNHKKLLCRKTDPDRNSVFIKAKVDTHKEKEASEKDKSV